MPDKKECCDIHQITSEFYDQILGFVIKNVKDIEIAKDITQEVIGKLIVAYNKNVKLGNARAWLFQVTRNLIIDKYRKKQFSSDSIDEIDDLPSEQIEFGVRVEDFIVPMIKLLPDKYGKPLYLSDIKGIKQQKIAEELGQNLSATKMRIQRARKMLKELFLECCDINYSETGSFESCTIKQNCDSLKKFEKQFKKDSTR